MSDSGTFMSTYTGAGGMDIGFAKAGFRPIWANDIDPAAVATYNTLFDDHLAWVGDIRHQALPTEGSADLVIGGPPCQGFSVAGRMDPNDPRSRHVWDFLGVVERVQPVAFVMENVKALAVNRRWAALRDALRLEAGKLGYQTQLLLLNAAHFDTPQARERMFLVGRRSGAPVIPIPTSALTPPAVRSALEAVPSIGEPGNEGLCHAVITPARKPVMRRSPFAGMLFNGQGRPMDLERPAPTLPASMGGNRTPIIDQDALDDGVENWVVGYHKHLWEGGEPYEGVPARLRRISVEEAAAIQTFPAGMRFCGRQSAQFRQIGNAVPPNLAHAVAEAVRRSLSGEGGTSSDGLIGSHATADQLIMQFAALIPSGQRLAPIVEDGLRQYATDGDPAHLAAAHHSIKSGAGVLRAEGSR